jgi:hypothetical protein
MGSIASAGVAGSADNQLMLDAAASFAGFLPSIGISISL